MSGLVFNPLGGIPQLHLASADHLTAIDTIDRARWAATSAPVEQLFCDPAFLAAMDTDGNGRVRVEEIRAARDWLFARLSGRDAMAARTDTLRLADLDGAGPGKDLKALADRLAAGGKDVTLAAIRAAKGSYTATFPNGDGVVTAPQVDGDEAQALLGDIVAHVGGTTDLSGNPGVKPEDLATWRGRCEALRAWRARGAVEGDGTVYTLGPDTGRLVGVIQGLAAKLHQFFAQCTLVATDPAAATRLQPTPDEIAALDVRSADAIAAWLEAAPLATPRADGVLDLTGALNPRYAGALATLRAEILPQLGLGDALSAKDVDALLARTAAWVAWQADKPAGIPDDLGEDRIDAALTGAGGEALLTACAADAAAASELQAFHDLEKVALYQRWLLELANNFVSFHDLFEAGSRSLIEMGTLVLDGRNLSLCTRVTNVAAHKAIADGSGLFLAYVEIRRKDGGADKVDTIAAAVTSGTRGGIDKGKRGVFYDRDGREYDALITDVIIKPISVWEAMLAPIDRLRTFVTDKLGNLVSSKAAAMEADATKGAEAATAVPKPAAPPAAGAAPAAGGGMGGMQTLLIGGSVAFAAIGSSLAFIASTLAAINPLSLVLGLGTVVAGLMAVSGVIGWFRLRQRDLSTLLEASGWALNGRMRMTFKLGDQFTVRPDLPQGSTVRLTAEQKRTRGILVLTALLLCGAGYWLWTHPEILERLAPEPPAAEAPADAAAEAPAG